MPDLIALSYHLNRALLAASNDEGVAGETIKAVRTIEVSDFMGPIGGGLAAAGAALAAGYGIGKLASSALEGIARQPEAADSLKGTMIVAAALIEGVCLFAVVVGLLAVVK